MKQYQIYFFALDPIHIGAGGYRLGRVDNTILRDAATGLPKIPGSSISGASRASSLYSLPEEQRKTAMDYAKGTLDAPNKERVHSGADDPVAQVYGYAEGSANGSSRIGMVSFYDAEILAFPVSSVNGPRWVTTPSLLRRAGAKNVPDLKTIECVMVKQQNSGRLNLGWMLLNTQMNSKYALPTLTNAVPTDMPSWYGEVNDRLVLVKEDLFPSIVNANLETRTSVSIDFETGAASDGALFTYEAIPRGTLFLGGLGFDNDRFANLLPTAEPLVQKGVKLACQLGLGGMTTRGFGRMDPLWELTHD
jgi:CRISPR-associated protein Cmr4